jgi:hypothetical protein
MAELLNLNEEMVQFQKARLLMGVWGLLILLAATITQFFELASSYVLWLWAGVTVLGLLCQVVCLLRFLLPNFGIWLFFIAAAWLFTLYVIKFDNGAHIDLYGDLAGVWLMALGCAYLATLVQVDRRFLLLAVLHLGVGILLELSARRVLTISFLDTYSTLIFGLVAGLPLLIGALPFWYRAPAAVAPPAQAIPS